MKLALTADLHGMLPPIPECDMLIIAGDICPVHDHSLFFQAAWLRLDFTNWLDEVPARHIVGVAGNHDFIAEQDIGLMRSLPWTYLCNETLHFVTDDMPGLIIHGTPMSGRFGPWAFMGEEHELAEYYRQIPEAIDILITHGPPYGAGDRVVNDRHAGDPHVGSKALREVITRDISVQLVVTGHIHEGYGDYLVGDTRVANVSHVDERYKPVHEVVMLEW